MKMIEVPEEHLRALKRWRAAECSARDLRPHIEALIACLPKQIEVGSRVRTAGGAAEGIVIAINDDKVWMRYDNGTYYFTWPIAGLEAIE